jgi:hypothetical protein
MTMTPRNIGWLLLLSVSTAASIGLSPPIAMGSTARGRCESVRASGGDYNGGGGAIYAELRITNTGARPCTISGRPWIRLPRLDHPVTVADWTDGPLAGKPGVSVTLAHGQRAHAFMLIVPGRCNRAKGTTFTLWAHAGWASKSVTVVGPACDDGTGQIDVGSFLR